jgi:hypothetical protein
MPDKEPKSTVGPEAPGIEFVKPSSRSRLGVDHTDPVATELEIGLVDNFIEGATTLDPATGIPLAAAVTGGANKLAEKDNPCGGDSRRFYLRVTDPAAAGDKFVTVQWWTTFSSKATDLQDDPGSLLHLFETGPKSGVFTSRGLMLVNNAFDRSHLQPDSGIDPKEPALGAAASKHAGRRADTDSNFRLRRAGMHHFGFSSYTPTRTPKSTFVSTGVPVFANPRTCGLQVYVLRDKPGGSPVYPLKDIFDKDLPLVTECYSRVGVWCWTMPPTTGLSGAARFSSGSIKYTVTEIDPPPGVDPFAFDEAATTAVGVALPPPRKGIIRLFFVAKLNMAITPQPLGITFGITDDPVPPAKCATKFTPDPPHSFGICIVGPSSNPDDHLTAAHEIGHLLTDKSKMIFIPASASGLLFDQCINETHYSNPPASRQPDRIDLMADNSLLPKLALANGFAHPRRIFDVFDRHFHNQHAKITSTTNPWTF